MPTKKTDTPEEVTEEMMEEQEVEEEISQSEDYQSLKALEVSAGPMGLDLITDKIGGATRGISDQFGELVSALCRAQLKVDLSDLRKTEKGYSGNYTFEKLDQTLSLIRKPLFEEGVFFTQPFELIEYKVVGKGRDIDITGKGKITTILLHTSNQLMWQSTEFPFDNTGNKNIQQAAGSAISYMRRYQLSSMLALAASKDDDGASASKAPEVDAEQGSGNQKSYYKNNNNTSNSGNSNNNAQRNQSQKVATRPPKNESKEKPVELDPNALAELKSDLEKANDQGALGQVKGKAFNYFKAGKIDQAQRQEILDGIEAKKSQSAPATEVAVEAAETE